jgi:hypothetical protein
MAMVNAVQHEPKQAQVVAAACIFTLLLKQGMVDVSATELMQLADRLIDSRDEYGVNGASAYMEHHIKEVRQ